MPYKIASIPSASSITTAEPLSISEILWNSKEFPASFGKIAYIPKKAIIVKLISNQSNPLRTYYEINSPVYKDSALEFFLQAELNNPNYLNFELNANGAMIVQWGSTQTNRTYLPEEKIKNCIVKAEITEDSWNIFLHIPLKFLNFFYPNLILEKGHPFRFNLYKICETKEFEHYMSLTAIPTPAPNFHQPQFFADGILD